MTEHQERGPDLILREKRRQELGETEFQSGSQGGALMQPRNGRELMDMANMMAGCGTMVRDFYRNSPGDCAALIMICQPYGFNPYQVSWKTYKASKNADAPVSFEGQLVNAMVNMSAPVKGRLRYRFEKEGTPDLTCTVSGIDRETGEEITYTSPPLKDIPVKNSPLWKGDPQQQLGYYSARAWARRHFPELLLGVYTREEIEEAPMRDVSQKPEATGGWADKARAARGPSKEQTEADQIDGVKDRHAPEPEDIPDAEVIPEFDEDAVDPMTDEYDEGVTAANQDAPETDCPHDPGTFEWNNWIGGHRFCTAQKEGE
ncbi:hypothetical protein GCM10011360_17880 [Primorskyibacter flagellatus]|uniref:RecT family protein n=1 Tax=Primorskyibacter flagellatus TaxID=1387277 RepID=A0A917A6A2_9RHOB|nr:recombinase RecT [Primorskyibacter flagellatus]GGE30265.1 hypothetical protein GCM10011360_17880 [Primorskyibacter flagellatus]